MADGLASSSLIVDASPLIALYKVGRQDLLLAWSKRLIVPTAVAEEIRAGPACDPARIALESGQLGQPLEVSPLPSVVEWGLGGRVQSPHALLQSLRDAGLRLDDRAIAEAMRGLFP
jgi:hypothetical protein